MVDVNKVIKGVVKKGTIKVGEKQTKISLENGTAKLVIISSNCPYSQEIETLSKQKNIPLYQYSSNGIDLGYACGKKFTISSLAVIDEGDSNIFQLVKKGK
ncbi:MAG: 50S ribosomal protein L30e [Thermoplasmatota archaeon]